MRIQFEVFQRFLRNARGWWILLHFASAEWDSQSPAMLEALAGADIQARNDFKVFSRSLSATTAASPFLQCRCGVMLRMLSTAAVI